MSLQTGLFQQRRHEFRFVREFSNGLIKPFTGLTREFNALHDFVGAVTLADAGNAAEAAEAAELAPRASMMAPPRLLTVGMK